MKSVYYFSDAAPWQKNMLCAKLILCFSPLLVIGKPLFAINDCSSYSFVFLLGFPFPLSPFLLVTRFYLEGFVTIFRQTRSLRIQMLMVVLYYLFILSVCLSVCLCLVVCVFGVFEG